jgi:hypothetical protein
MECENITSWTLSGGEEIKTYTPKGIKGRKPENYINESGGGTPHT